MNKKELATTLADKHELDVTKATDLVGDILTAMAETLNNGEEVVLPPFGKFVIKDRAARKGRNPSTGAEIDIPASKVVQFKPAKQLKESVNN